MHGFGWVLGAAGLALLIGCAGGGGSKPSARKLCAKNLLRLRAALLTYANDHDDVLPLANWNAGLAPYLLTNPQTGQTPVLRCPAVAEGAGVGYAMNSTLVGAQLNSVPNQDATALFFDVADLSPNVVSAYPPATSSRRHRGAATVYLSGRVVPEVDPDDVIPPTVQQRCVARLRRIALASALYTSDYDDRLPPADWMDAFQPYVQPTNNPDDLRCPAVASGSYGYAFDPSLLGLNVTTATSPATTPMAFDSSLLTRNALSAYGQNRPNRHDGDVVAYLDGHAAPANP